MKQVQHIDLRVQKTQAAIKNTFKEMICEMDPHNITIKELTQRAKIHRKTFYLHYSSLEALFEDMLQDIANNYYNDIDQIAPPMPMSEVNRVFFTNLSRQDDYVQHLILAPSYSDFCNRLFSATLKHNRERYNPYAHLSEDQQNLVNTFLTHSSLDMYRQWLNDGRKMPLEEVIAFTNKLLCNGVEAILK